jgi:hypothetical protein
VSVSGAFKFLGNEEHDETARFCHMFNRFFDCMNTCNMHEGKRKRNSDLEPYISIDDDRFQVNLLFKESKSIISVYM